MSKGYEFNLKDNGCLFYLNGMFHGYAPIVDGFFILNLEHELVYNVNVDMSPSYLLFQTLLPLFWTLTCMI